MLKQLFINTFNLMRLKAGPADFPYSPMTFTIWFVITMGLFLYATSSTNGVFTSVNFVFGLAILALLLWVMRKKQRFIQVGLAYLACTWVINIVFIILIYLNRFVIFHYLQAHGISLTMANTLPKGAIAAAVPPVIKTLAALAFIAVFAWKLLVETIIVGKSLEISKFRAILYVFIMNFTIPFLQALIIRFS